MDEVTCRGGEEEAERHMEYACLIYLCVRPHLSGMHKPRQMPKQMGTAANQVMTAAGSKTGCDKGGYPWVHSTDCVYVHIIYDVHSRAKKDWLTCFCSSAACTLSLRDLLLHITYLCCVTGMPFCLFPNSKTFFHLDKFGRAGPLASCVFSSTMPVFVCFCNLYQHQNFECMQ